MYCVTNNNWNVCKIFTVFIQTVKSFDYVLKNIKNITNYKYIVYIVNKQKEKKM